MATQVFSRFPQDPAQVLFIPPVKHALMGNEIPRKIEGSQFNPRPRVNNLMNHLAPRSRREILRVGLGGISSLSLPALLKKRAGAAPVNSGDTAIILVWLPGGHSHLETYDPKPDSGSDFRGPYNPIETVSPGMRLCELLPHHARVADRFSLLRSVAHGGFCHQQGTH